MIHDIFLALKATGSMLLQDLQRRTANREQDRRRLTDSEERLTQTRKSKIAVDEKVSQIMSHLEKLRTRVQKIVQEKKIIEIELQSKRQLLSQLRSESKKDEVITTLLEEKIQRNVEDAEKLEKELKRKESDLVSAQQESRTRQEELSQARAELKRKHVEVQEIQQEYEKLASCYDIGMEQRSKLIQLLAADKEDMQVCASVVYISYGASNNMDNRLANLHSLCACSKFSLGTAGWFDSRVREQVTTD